MIQASAPAPLPILDTAAFEARARESLSEARARRDGFALLPPETPFGEVAQAFDRVSEPLVNTTGWLSLTSSTHPDEARRKLAEELEQELSALSVELSLDRALFERLEALDLSQASGPEEKRLVEHALRDFRRAGVDRDDATRERIRALKEELVVIGQNFDRGILEGGRTLVIEDGHAGLAGMPADYIASHPEGPDGSVRVTTDMPDYVPFMTYAERGDLRRKLALERMNVGYPGNEEVLRELLAKRHELATLLGYAHWADYATEVEMVGSAAQASSFLERVTRLAQGGVAAELEALAAVKAELEGAEAEVNSADIGFLRERVRRARFDVDSQEVRGYFGYEAVKRGLFETIERLFGVKIEAAPEVPVWHASVECYVLREEQRVIGRFYLDMFPREGKFKHAACFDVGAGVEGEVLAEAALVCNFSQPDESDPALMLHEQVTTFFHEFGHLLHHLFAGRGRFVAFSGISCEGDFIEVPSQLFEEWAWDPAVLATFALHHESGKPIPADLVARMRTAEEYGKSLHVLRQMVFAQLSLGLHDQDPSGLDIAALDERLHREIYPVARDEGGHFFAGFGHLNGYSTAYYTYMWSLVIAKDLWGQFEATPMDSKTAQAYRDTVLSVGGARDAADQVETMLGRGYSFEAFQRWLEA